jgi:hypothetical protein
MSVWLDKTGRRQDGGRRSSGRTTVRPKFQKFLWKSFLFESRVWIVLPHCPDSRTSAASNFHIKASCIRTRRMVVRTVDQMHAISIFDAHASGPCWLASGRLDLNCDTCLMDERESTSSGRLQRSSHICVLERNSEALVQHWGSSGRAAETSGRMQAGTVRSFSTKGKVRTGIHVVWTDDDLADWCLDGMACRLDGWQEIEFFDLQTVQNLPKSTFE